MLRLTREQARMIDRRAIDEYHIPGVVLMENAARAAADIACQMLSNDCGGEVLILCGGGNNGGDGLAIARHLHNRGADVRVALTIDPDHYKDEAKVNWQIVQAMKLPTYKATADFIRRTAALLLVDAIFGTGLTQPPRDPFPALADAVNKHRAPVLAIDAPSGLDCDTGVPFGACIAATRTITFVAEKVGFSHPEARRWLGEVTVGDIGCPRELVRATANPPPPDLATGG